MEAQEYLKNVNHGQANSAVPKPPKPGEIMRCQHCGKAMHPEDFSEQEIVRRREFKWQMHQKCMLAAELQCDLNTPGILSERQQRQK